MAPVKCYEKRCKKNATWKVFSTDGGEHFFCDGHYEIEATKMNGTVAHPIENHTTKMARP